MLKIPLCFAMFCLLSVPAMAMTITSNGPGNVFLADSPIHIAIKDAQGNVSYELMDYFGKKVKSGEANSNIDIPGLKPGWYELKCKDNAGNASAFIGVVMNRGNAPLPEDGRICTDVAGAWLVDQNNFKALTRMVRMAGIPWVRERLSWGGTEGERGKIDWNRYQAMADDYAAEGIHICQMWHEAPQWVRDNNTGYPEDMRDYYKFARTASSHFSKQIEAWEVWNEPDGGLSSSDLYTGMVKAAYLGIKDGNPKVKVLLGSICRGVTNFTDGLYESGATDYFDIFNWHIYSKPAIYPGAFKSHLDALHKYGADVRPAWITESGVVEKGTEGPTKRLLNDKNRHEQCQFMPRAAAMSLVAGVDKNFFFVLPNCVEEDTQWGALQPDLTPYPSFVALSAAANILGQSTYRGEYKTGNKNVVAQVFSTPKGNVLIAWSDVESKITVPTSKKTIKVANIFGNESTAASKNGKLTVKVGPDAIYLLDIGKPVENKLTGKPRPRGKLPTLNPSHVIIVGHSDLPVLKDSIAYRISDRSGFDYTVDVYNLTDQNKASGKIELKAPMGWIIDRPVREITLNAMDRQKVVFHVKPGTPAAGQIKIRVDGEFGNKKISPCVSSFNFDISKITPVKTKPLNWADNPTQWFSEASPNCTVKISKSEPGTLQFDMSFKGVGDRWAYPILSFKKPMDFSKYDGIAFDLDVPKDSPGTVMRIMIVESGGAHYISAMPAIGTKHRVVLLFKFLNRLDFMGADDNGRLDLDAIAKVKLGCNAGEEHVAFNVSNFELVKF